MQEVEINESVYIQTMLYAEKHKSGFSQKNLLDNVVADFITKEIISKYFEWADLNSMAFNFNGSGGINAERQTIFIRISNRDVDGASTPFYILTHSAYFDYLSFIELTEARRSAKDARFWSITALCVAIATSLGSMYVQIMGKTTIDQKQFETILNEQKDFNSNFDEYLKQQKSNIDKIDNVENKLLRFGLENQINKNEIIQHIETLKK